MNKTQRAALLAAADNNVGSVTVASRTSTAEATVTQKQLDWLLESGYVYPQGSRWAITPAGTQEREAL